MKFKILVIACICVVMTLFSFKPNDRTIIVIDAGHGGKDFGAVIGNLKEKDIVRKFAEHIVKANNDPNIEFFTVGEEDVFIDMDERIKAINSLNPDVVISLHVNASPNKEVRGSSIIISPKSENFAKSKVIANNILNSIPKINNVQNQFIEQNLKVLNGANCPALNFQIGYISNAEDCKMMTSDKEQQKLAGIILENILKQ